MTEDEMNRFIDSLSLATPEPEFNVRNLPSPRAYGTIHPDSGVSAGGGGQLDVNGNPRDISFSPGFRAGPVSAGAMLAAGNDMPAPSVGYRVGADLPGGFSAGYSRMHPTDAPSQYDQRTLSLARQILGGNIAGTTTEQDGRRGYGMSASHPLGSSGNAFVNAQRDPRGGHTVMGGMDMRFARGGYAGGGDAEVQSNGMPVISDGQVNWGDTAADFARADAAMQAMRNAPVPAPEPQATPRLEPRRPPPVYSAPRDVPLPPVRPASLDRPYEPEGPFGALDMSTMQPKPKPNISMGYGDASPPFDVTGPDAPRFGLPEGYIPVGPTPYDPEGPFGALDMSSMQPPPAPKPDARPYDPEGPFGALDMSSMQPPAAPQPTTDELLSVLSGSAKAEPTTDELLSILTAPSPQPADAPLPPPRPASLDAAPRSMPNLNPQQRDLIARTIAAETSGKTPEEAQAIGHVILNRISSGKYGSTPEKVLFAPKQFEPWADPRGSNYPMRHKPGTKKYESAMQALDAAMGNEDITGGAMSFWAPKAQAALGRPAPKWGRTGGLDIGDTRFHREHGGMAVEREHHADGDPVGDDTDYSEAPPLTIHRKVNSDIPVGPMDVSGDQGPSYDQMGNIISPGRNADPIVDAAMRVIPSRRETQSPDNLAQRIRDYERQRAEIDAMPEYYRQMTHGPEAPRAPIDVEGGFIGKSQFGTAPYNVAKPISQLAQTAYDMKTLPLYAAGSVFPPAAGLGMALDTAEGVAAGSPTQVAMGAFGAPGKIMKYGAAPLIAATGMLSPDEAQAAKLPKIGKAAYGIAHAATPGGEMSLERAMEVAQKAASSPDLRASTRFPTGAKSIENPLTQQLTIGPAEMKASPGFEHNMNLLPEYPGFAHLRGLAPEDQLSGYIDQARGNLNFLYENAPDIMRQRSPLWYEGANNFSDALASRYGIPRQSSSAAIAALSPQMDWYKNASLAERVGDAIFSPTASRRMTPEMEAFQKSSEALTNDANQRVFDAIRGKRLSDLTDPLDQALWIRLYDEAHNPRNYRSLSPEGNIGDYIKSASGDPSKIGWGSLNEIAKAVRAYTSGGDMNVISPMLGTKHKVRSFYNNIELPNDLRFGDVTADTHAVAASQLRPLSGNTPAVAHNLALGLAKNKQPPGYLSEKSSAITGVQGTYGANAEATRLAAADQGLLPREMQSATWEPVRELFPAKWKNPKNVEAVDNIWRQKDAGNITAEQARNAILDLAGGFSQPSWSERGFTAIDPRKASTYR